MHALKREPDSPDEEPSQHEEMTAALELMMLRMEAVGARCGDSFPLYSPKDSGEWVVSPGGSWVGGFWSGWWWLRTQITGSPLDLRQASDICQRLAPKLGADSANRSLIFWYGASLGNRWLDDANARRLAEDAACVLAASYDKRMSCIPLGMDMGGGKDGNRIITIDTLGALIQILGLSGRDDHASIARRHADTILDACRTGEGAFHPAACFHEGSFHPSDEAGMWSRGQAWAMLGLSRAAARWGEPYLSHAQTACGYWMRSRPTSVPLDRLNHPSGFSDPSSSVIASLAMLTLADLVPDGSLWRARAHQQITSIIRSRYFTGFQENEDPETSQRAIASGIFWGCCYKTRHGQIELVESAWGGFFLMAALCVLIGAIEANDC